MVTGLIAVLMHRESQQDRTLAMASSARDDPKCYYDFQKRVTWESSSVLESYDCVSYNPLRPGWKAPRSLHPGGVNVMFCDGHVQFIKDTINPVTWTGLGTRNCGEVISAAAF